MPTCSSGRRAFCREIPQPSSMSAEPCSAFSPWRCAMPGGWSSMWSRKADDGLQRFPKPNAPGWHSSGLTRLRRDMKKRVECECGWVLETDDEEKLVKGVQEHASEVHHMQGVTRDQVLAQAKPA